MQILEPRTEQLLCWYYCQTDFERSTLGSMLELADLYQDGVARAVTERNRWVRQRIAEIKAAGGKHTAGEPVLEVTARPTRETRQPGGNLPSDAAYERKAFVESRLLTMERMGRRRETAILEQLFGPTGCYFVDSRLPRASALILWTEPGLRFLHRAHKLLRLTPVGADLEAANLQLPRDQRRPIPEQELGERGRAHHEQIVLHAHRIHQKEYGDHRVLWAEATLAADQLAAVAVDAWRAAEATRCRMPCSTKVCAVCQGGGRAWDSARSERKRDAILAEWAVLDRARPPATRIEARPAPPVPMPAPSSPDTSAAGERMVEVTLVVGRDRRCSVCGEGARKRCSYELRGTKAGKPCGVWLCDACAWEVAPGVHHCGPHARLMQEGKESNPP